MFRWGEGGIRADLGRPSGLVPSPVSMPAECASDDNACDRSTAPPHTRTPDVTTAPPTRTPDVTTAAPDTVARPRHRKPHSRITAATVNVRPKRGVSGGRGDGGGSCYAAVLPPSPLLLSPLLLLLMLTVCHGGRAAPDITMSIHGTAVGGVGTAEDRSQSFFTVNQVSVLRRGRVRNAFHLYFIQTTNNY